MYSSQNAGQFFRADMRAGSKLSSSFAVMLVFMLPVFASVCSSLALNANHRCYCVILCWWKPMRVAVKEFVNG